MHPLGKILKTVILLGALTYVVAGLTICRPHDGFCKGKGCDTESKCENGTCQQDGSCLCNPCFSGDTCGQVEDKHYPYFLKDEETIFIDALHKGLIYQAAAVDDDKFKTCVPGSSFPCPCGKVYYELITDFGEESTSVFEINNENGDISIKRGSKLKGGEVYKVDIAASNYHENGDYESNVLSIDILKLKINVQESNSIEEFLKESDAIDMEKEKEKYTEESNARTSFENENEQDFEVAPLERFKRDAFGPNKEDTNLSLAIVGGSPNDPLKPGDSTEFEITIILPKLAATDPMDFKVELYVMDTITGITTLALCDVRVISIGSNKIKKKDGTDLTIADIKITSTSNEFFTSIYDRSILDFGDIYNEDLVGTADYSPSTIKVGFTSVMVLNSKFTNTTAIVTAGAEYSNEQYVWVSQAIMNYTLDTSVFGANVTCSGPDAIPANGGAQFDIMAYLTNPYENVEIEIFTPDNIADKFSVTSLQVVSKGEGHSCVISAETLDFYQSVSGKTNHRVVLSFNILVKDGKVGLIIDPKNLILISFTIQTHNVKIGDKIEIGAGLLIGTTTIWTAQSTVDIDGTAITSAGPSGMTVYPLDKRNAPNNPQVMAGQSATFGIKLQMTANSAIDVDCSVTAVGTNKVCGVLYGRSGRYAASFPDLLKNDLVIYNADGTASWKLKILNGVTHASDQPARNTSEEFVSFEVTLIVNAFTNPAATVTCGTSAPLNVYQATVNATQDMSGYAVLLGDDANWYSGSHAALLANLYFPPNGLPYKTATFETSGDFFQTSYGARVCAIDIMDLGRGASCMAKIGSKLAVNSKYKKALNSSAYTDSVEIEFGEQCGSFIQDAKIGDNNVSIRIAYEIPFGQSGVVASPFNLSLGILFDDEMIWTGWSTYSVKTGALTGAPNPLPYFFTFPGTNDVNAQEFQQFLPFVTTVVIKGHPGSVVNYRIKATTTNSAILEICRIVFLHVGRNYACFDRLPYGKQNNADQVVKIIHDSTWVVSADLDMGIVRNFGWEDIYTSPIADEDAIQIGVIARGISIGTANITVEYNDGRAAPLIESEMYTVTALAETTTTALSVNVSGIDGTMDFYEDVMKQVEISITFTEGYNKYVKIEIVNQAPTTTTLCYAGVAWSGVNVPCIIPFLNKPTRAIDASGAEVVTIDFGRACYFPSSDNKSESVVKIRAGFMPNVDLTESKFKVNLYEGKDSTTISITQEYTITLSSGTFNQGNVSLSGINVYPVDNSTAASSIEPGVELWFGIYIQLPPYITVPAEFGVMTTSMAGHATATVHGFRWGDKQGMNIGCIQGLDMYSYELFQNASQDSVAMYHTSQTDTMVVKLKYLTNTGLSYMQQYQKPEDDLAMIEAHLLIADHEGLNNGDILTISFSIKIGAAIVVYEKNYTFVKPATSNVMVLETEFFYSNPSATFETTYATGEKLELTGRMKHVWNESHIEAYDARIRILVPSYVKFANSTMQLVSGALPDKQSINITSVFTSEKIIEFDIDFLFFTDIVEFNLTLSIDPDMANQMPKGLGRLEATALMRLVCRESKMTATAKYCAKTKYLNYFVQGTDCFDDLAVNSFSTCQFHASTAIDETTLPSNAATADTAVWSPAVRDSKIFDHYIDVDFLRKTRITKITFTKEGTKRTITKFSLQTSYDGIIFANACPNNTMVPGELPSECRTETRYARINIVETDSTDETVAIGIKFKWYGCFMETTLGSCTFPETTLTNNVSAWRHVAHDPTADIIYFCDYSPVKERMVCYSSKGGSSWNALPSYIASLAGYDTGATKKMYARDSKKRTLVASADGVNWALVDSSVESSLTLTAPTNLPGKDEASLTAATLGSWTADFYGLKTGGALKAKWNTCCG